MPTTALTRSIDELVPKSERPPLPAGQRLAVQLEVSRPSAPRLAVRGIDSDEPGEHAIGRLVPMEFGPQT